jgi:tripartite-type tricarboxylate transporter receptor subunit TctC
LIAGQIEVLFPSLGSSIEYVKAGQLRALAVTDLTRSDALPDLPPVAETLPGYPGYLTQFGASGRRISD